MDAPIRRYVRLQEQESNGGQPAATTGTGRRKRKRPFEAEWALLKELAWPESRNMPAGSLPHTRRAVMADARWERVCRVHARGDDDSRNLLGSSIADELPYRRV